MTSEPPSSATAVVLSADHQAGVIERVIKAPPRVEVWRFIVSPQWRVSFGGLPTQWYDRPHFTHT